MAAAVFNDLAAKEAAASAAWLGENPAGRPVALSAGLEAVEGAPITDLAVLALGEAGIPSVPGNTYANHTARQADRELLASCDLIVGISRRHGMALICCYPELASRITTLPQDIPDPFGGDLSVYRACLAALTQGIQDMFFPQPEA
jgi:protein-tyrosine-phosphatase